MRLRALARRHATDLTLALALGALALLGTAAGVRRLSPTIRAPAMSDVWFDGDIPRVSTVLVDRWSDKHQRAQLHPLFPLLTVAGYVLRGAGMSRPAAVTTIVLVSAFLWPIGLFALLRLAWCTPLDAALFTLVGLVSAAAVFWLTVPESWTLGSLSIMVGLMPAAVARWRPVRERWLMLASAVSLSITTTDWMAGLLSTAATLRWRRALQVTVNAFAAVVLLWAVQKRFAPGAGFFLDPPASERQFMFRPTAERLATVGRAFVVRSMVAPDLQKVVRSYPSPIAGAPADTGIALSMQHSSSGGALGWIAAVAWLALLGIGLAAAAVERSRFVVVLGLFLLGQFGLHALYGKETFLYSLDFLPALVVLAALGTSGRWRRAVRAGAFGLVVLAGTDNARQFGRAADFVAAEAGRVHIDGIVVANPPP